MGISPSAWQEAAEVMGPQHAAIVLAAILQRAEHIHSRGGYLRDLVERARQQKFSVWPMITALLNARMGELEKAAASSVAGGTPDGQGAEPGVGASLLEISSALLDSMKKKGW
jgi:replication initiation protein RepC